MVKTINEEDLWLLMCEMYRILKKDRHAFIMSDGQTLKWIIAFAEEAGFKYYKPIFWDKITMGMGYHLRCQHEFVVILDKGRNRKPKDLSISDVIKVKMVKGGYRTEKPEGLVDIFVEQFTEKKELVVDPFCGSGVVGRSSKKKGRNFIIGDIETNTVNLSRNKLSGITRPIEF